MMTDKEQIRTLIKLHNGDELVENAIKRQKKHIQNEKRIMLDNLETIIRHDEKWTERATALNDYQTKYPDELEEWYEELIDISGDNDINIDDIVYNTEIDTLDKTIKIEQRLLKILKECIIKL